jgi:hypothetical protein
MALWDPNFLDIALVRLNLAVACLLSTAAILQRAAKTVIGKRLRKSSRPPGFLKD